MSDLCTITIFALAVLTGCSDAEPSSVDASADAGTDAAPPAMLAIDPPAPPMPPELPRLVPCPTGFRETSDGEITVCDPFPESGREPCADGMAHLPGSPGCTPIGSACPSDEWAPVDGLASVAFVRAGASPGGDGSRTAPFATIAAALAAPVRAEVIALARGTYDEPVDLPSATTLLGACTAETILAPSSPADTPVVRAGDGAVAVADLTIDGGSPAILIEDGAELDLRGVAIARSSGAAVVVRTGARFRAEGLRVRDVSASTTGAGHALDVDGATAEVRNAAIERATEHAITVRGATASVVLERCDVRDTQSRATDRLLGQALTMTGGATATIDASHFEGHRDKAIRADDAGTTLRITDTTIRDTAARDADGLLGFGLAVANGATAELDRVVLDRSTSMAIAVQHSGSMVSITDSVIRDTRPSATGEVGHGVDVQGGANALLRRVAILRCTSAGVFASQSSTVTAEDLVVLDTRVRPADGFLGFGVRARDLAQVTVRRARIERNRTGGVMASAASETAEVGPRVELEDVVVSDTGSADDGTLGVGIGIAAGELVARRVLVQRGYGGGIFAAYAGSSALEDVRVEAVEPVASDGSLGAGIVIFEGHTATVLRAAIEGTHAVGLWSVEGSAVVASHVAVRSTAESDCEDCDRGGFGIAAHRSTLSLSDFASEDNALCGVAVGVGAEVDLERGLVAGNPIGANVQPPGYDLGRISREVVYRDNDIALDSSALPAPTPSFGLTP